MRDGWTNRQIDVGLLVCRKWRFSVMDVLSNHWEQVGSL